MKSFLMFDVLGHICLHFDGEMVDTDLETGFDFITRWYDFIFKVAGLCLSRDVCFQRNMNEVCGDPLWCCLLNCIITYL